MASENKDSEEKAANRGTGNRGVENRGTSDQGVENRISTPGRTKFPQKRQTGRDALRLGEKHEVVEHMFERPVRYVQTARGPKPTSEVVGHRYHTVTRQGHVVDSWSEDIHANEQVPDAIAGADPGEARGVNRRVDEKARPTENSNRGLSEAGRKPKRRRRPPTAPKRWVGDDPEHKKELERELAKEREQRRREEMRRKHREKYSGFANRPPKITWFDPLNWHVWVKWFLEKEKERSYEKWNKRVEDNPDDVGARKRRDQELEISNRHTRDFDRVMRRVANRNYWPQFVKSLKALEGELKAGQIVEAVVVNPIRGYEALTTLALGTLQPGSGIWGAYERLKPPYTELWRNTKELKEAFATPLTFE